MHYEFIKQSSIKNIIFYNAGATFLKCVHASHFLLNAGIGRSQSCTRGRGNQPLQQGSGISIVRKGRGDPQGNQPGVTEKVSTASRLMNLQYKETRSEVNSGYLHQSQAFQINQVFHRAEYVTLKEQKILEKSFLKCIKSYLFFINKHVLHHSEH